MAKYYRVAKTPTVFEQTDTSLNPITSTAGFSDWGNVQDISQEEMSGLQSRYSIGAPVGADYLNPIGTQDIYKYSPTGLQKTTQANATALGGKIGQVGADVLSLYKQGDPITNYEIPQTIKSSLETKYNVPTAEANKEGLVSSLVSKAKDFASNILGKKTESLATLKPYQEKLDAISTEIATKEGEYEKSMQDIEGKPIGMAAIGGEQAQLTKLANIELKTLYAKQSALNGNYERAYSLATDAYNTYVQSEEQEINALQIELDQAKETLTGAEKKVADDYSVALEQYKTDLSGEKELQDQKIALMLEYASAGITPQDTWDQAIAKAGAVASKKEQKELSLLDAQIQTERLQGAKISADILKTQADTAKVIAGETNDGSLIKTTTLDSATQLFQKFMDKQGTSAVGKSNKLAGVIDWLTPGTERADFVTNYDNLKALMSLENIKLLKGQGAISDGERRTLEQASSQLSRNQSEGAFQSTLQDIIKALGGASSTAGGDAYTSSTGKTYYFK